MAKTDPNDAITLLKADHERVKTLLKKLQKTSDDDPSARTELLDEIRHELEAHMRIEEEIFYPAFRSALSTKEGDKLYYEAVEEHHAASVVLNDALQADPASPNFAGKAKVLAELVLHHADEEEKEMFPKARKALSLEGRRALGEQMQDLKRDALAGAA